MLAAYETGVGKTTRRKRAKLGIKLIVNYLHIQSVNI